MDPLVKKLLPRGVDFRWEAWCPGRKHADVTVGGLCLLPPEDVILTCTDWVLEYIHAAWWQGEIEYEW